MPIMIKVTLTNGRKSWLNASQIQTFCEYDSGTAIWLMGEDEKFLVREGPETIDSLIDAAIRYQAQQTGEYFGK